MFWVNQQYESMLAEADIDSYDALVELAPESYFVSKQGRTTARYEVVAAGRPLSFYLKKYMYIPWWKCRLLPIDSFPGPRELANLRKAAALGVRVPEPIAAGADCRHTCKSLLAVRELKGYTPLHEFIPFLLAHAGAAERRAMRRELSFRLADIARTLHSAHFFHRDFYLCHFFFRETAPDSETPSPSRSDLVLIDLMRLKHSGLRRWQVKDLAQLLFSSDLAGITRTDRMRFFKHYLGIERLDPDARRLLQRVMRKARGYHRHNAALEKTKSCK